MKVSNKAFAVAGLGLLSAVAVAGTATAGDTFSPPSYGQLAGMGSDTTQDVVSKITTTINAAHAAPDGTSAGLIASYDAVGSATVSTKAAAACQNITRQNGSGNGINFLAATTTAGNNCIDFARSSSGPGTASPTGYTWIPFAADTVSFVVTNTSSLPRSLSIPDLKALYTCDPAFVGSGTNNAAGDAPTGWSFTPVLPQAGSGTRSYWEGQMGLTDSAVNANPQCLYNGKKNGVLIEEHTSSFLDDKSIVPFSIANYLNQQYLLGTLDKRGRGVIGTIGTGNTAGVGSAITGGTSPVLNNAAFNIKRNLYNVIKTTNVGVAPWSSTFVGGSSYVCQDTADRDLYNFAAPTLACGDTTTTH